MDYLNWNAISGVANCVAALGIVLVGFQLAIYKRELRDDHERSRRENAINFLLEWSKGLGRNASLTKKLVELFDESQVRALVELRPFNVAEEHRDLLAGCLESHATNEELAATKGVIKLNENHAKILKWQVVSYLNLLEAILSAWRHNTADRDIIEEQFKSLIAPEKRLTIVENYRQAAGGPDALPAISEFVKTVLKKRLDEKHRLDAADLKKMAGKPPLGIKH